ncbi:MAG: hypothetical protein DWQ02_11810 [Bacteroidetes bacterium]|nr:MAG: hypothetical protein DWQ02_11810 [Bacteroidota bacterium]
MTPRNIVAVILIIISLICLYPGLTLPILSIYVGAKIPIIGEIGLHDSTQSIMKTIRTLWENDNNLVANLILLFSVLVPIFKALTLLVVLFFKQIKNRTLLHWFVATISKWSMADVFVVGVLLAFLATKSDDNIHAQLHEGFHYFLAYCIISILATQLINVGEKEKI